MALDEDVATATTLVSTGSVPRMTDSRTSTLSGTGDYSTCYRGKAYAAVGVPSLGGDTRSVSGNQVCTAPRPILNPPCEWRPEGCGEPIENCPLIVNTGNGPWHLAGLDDSVLFDIDADGHRDRIAWTARGSSLAFVALDRNGNGMIDDASELFGNHTPLANGSIASNGFEALKAFDLNRDDQIDEHDTVWSMLLLWTDENHDGHSQSAELTEIANSPIRAVGTEYHWTGRTDRIGNELRFQSMLLTDGRQEPYYDIYFLMAK